ncbi:MAG TPA: DUF3179 domain-containing protein [Nitriliruptorales bacterium]|nr:DUF3179 domain-containing protein [Nitriliruptorales bacterium]
MSGARVLSITLGLALVAAACTTSRSDDGAGTAAGAGAAPDGLPEGPSALDDMTDPSFPQPLVDPVQIVSGGPPPDGIPPIDEPQFVSVADAGQWLASDEPVIAVEIDGDARAYPVQILIWHEIVNDTVAGAPVTVTYCPLCNTGVSFVRVVDGVEVTFGTSGRLFASALVMYDRPTESLWTHFDGRAVVGLLTGEQLEVIPSPLLAWSEFAASFPDGRVLDRDRTRFRRNYGTNPYEGYDRPDARPFLFRGEVDDRARAMQRVVGVERGGEATAWPVEAVSGDGAAVTYGEVGGDEIVILWKAGQSTALEANEVDAGRDVGSVGVFLPQVGERRLTLRAEGDGFRDAETGSVWDVAGQATGGPLEGASLDRINHFVTFWFAWSTYQPGTTLVEDGA